MKKKKEIFIIIALVLVVCVVMTFFVKSLSNNKTTQYPSDTTISEQLTSVPVQTDMTEATTENITEATTEPITEATTATIEITVPVIQETTAQQITEPTTEQITTQAPPVVDETAEILSVVYDAMNLLKSNQANFTGHKVQNIDLKLVDSSIPSMNNVANGIIGMFINEEAYDYDFTNGVSADPESGGTINSNTAFPPGDLNFTLSREGVASARKTMDGINTVYTVVIVHETSTLENPRPPHHNSGADTLDLSGIEIPMVTINRVDFDYPGAEISVTISPDGEIVGYHEHLEMSGTGEVSGFGMTGFGTISGYIDEKWDIKWK